MKASTVKGETERELKPTMKLTNHSAVPVYTISGSSTARPLPEWLARKRKRSLKNDPEFANRIELLQDFEFEEASQCVRVSDDGQWVMSTGEYHGTSNQLVPVNESPRSASALLHHRVLIQHRYQGPTNPKYTPIIYHTFPYLSHGTPSP